MAKSETDLRKLFFTKLTELDSEITIEGEAITIANLVIKHSSLMRKLCRPLKSEEEVDSKVEEIKNLRMEINGHMGWM